MNDSQTRKQLQAIDRAIALVETALEACDEQGFMYPAIDLSSALDKLQLLKQTLASD